MLQKLIYLFIFLMMSVPLAYSQSVIPLYPAEIPNSRPSPDSEQTTTTGGKTRIAKVSVPTLTVFTPEKNKSNGTAVLICPGGGYSIIAIGHEGFDVAKEFNKLGVTAFVLKYRLPDSRIMTDKETGPLQDALQAMKVIREGASSWNINPNRIGIMGFSAGGHLAASAGTRYSEKIPGLTSALSLRPDFMILVYPVISFTDALTHKGSRTRLLDSLQSSEKIEAFSAEQNVDQQTPPTFLVHAGDDRTVKVGNSIAFYEALNGHGVQAELHIYPYGGHGFGLKNVKAADSWFERCRN